MVAPSKRKKRTPFVPAPNDDFYTPSYKRSQTSTTLPGMAPVDHTPGKFDDPEVQRKITASNYADFVTNKAQAENAVNGTLSENTKSLIKGLEDARLRQQALGRSDFWIDTDGVEHYFQNEEDQNRYIGPQHDSAERPQWLKNTLNVTNPIIGKTLEVLDLPRAAVTSGINVTANAVSGKKDTGFVEGIKKHIGPEAILKHLPGASHFKDNPIAQLGTSLISDPLTYVSGGIARGASAAAAEGRAAQAAARFARSAEGVDRLTDLRNTYIAAAVPTGGVVTPAVKTWAKTQAEKALTTEVVRKAEQQAADLVKGRVELRLLGRPVGSSEKLYAAAAKPGKLIGDTRAGKWFGAVFDASHDMPFEMRRMERQQQSSVAAEFAARQEVEAPFWKELSKKEFDTVVSAKMDGARLPGLVSKAGRPMDEYLDKMQTIFDETYTVKTNTGRYNPAQNPAFDEYFPAYFKQGGNAREQASRAKWVTGRKQWVRNLDIAQEDLIKALAASDPKAIAKAQSNLLTLKASGKVQFGHKTFKELGGITDDWQAISAELSSMYSNVARKRWVDQLADNFGVTSGKASIRKPDGSYVTVKTDPAIMSELGMILKTKNPQGGWERYLSKDTWLPQDVLDQFDKIHDIMVTESATQQMASTVEKAINYWKFAVTSANPGHHVKNLAGDTISNWLDGVISPIPYMQAAKIMRDPASVSIKIGNKVLSGDEVLAHYAMSGAKTGRTASEHQLLGNTGSGFMHKVKDLSESREDYGRIAHFIDAWKKEAAGKNPRLVMTDARDAAAARVIRFNHDFMDITNTERGLAKWVYPFYTWSRKNLPLQLETLLLKPGKFNQIMRATGTLMDQLGVDTEGHGNPLSVMVPQWLRDTNPIKLADETAQRGQLFATGQWNPMNEILQFGGGRDNLVKTFIGGLNPLGRVAYEQMTGTRLPTGQNIGSLDEYGMNQLPFTRLIQTMLSGPDKKTNMQKILAAVNWTTGAGLQEVTEKSKLAEIHRMEDANPNRAKKLTEMRREAYNNG